VVKDGGRTVSKVRYVTYWEESGRTRTKRKAGNQGERSNRVKNPSEIEEKKCLAEEFLLVKRGWGANGGPL